MEGGTRVLDAPLMYSTTSYKLSDVVVPFFAGIGIRIVIIATRKIRLESHNHNISIDIMIPLFIGFGIGTIHF